jgi:hypothetical protein
MGDGELTGEEVVAKVALMPEVIAVGLDSKVVLDKEEVTVERIPVSDGDGEGWQWLTTVSRGEQPGVEQSGVRHVREGWKNGGAPTVPMREVVAATVQCQ